MDNFYCIILSCCWYSSWQLSVVMMTVVNLSIDYH